MLRSIYVSRCFPGRVPNEAENPAAHNFCAERFCAVRGSIELSLQIYLPKAEALTRFAPKAGVEKGRAVFHANREF